MDRFLSLDSLGELGWGIELFAVVTVTLVARLIAMRILKIMGRHLEKTENVWDDAVFEAAKAPLSWFILIVGLLWAIEISDGYLEIELFSPSNLEIMRQLTFIVLIMIFLVRFVSLSETKLIERLKADPDSEQTRLDSTTLNALAKLLRLSIIISAALIALPTVGIEITALLAFGGVGGLAVGFAAQDLLSNFFGGLMIYLDRPFAVGDWIRSPDRDIEGTVESIGWRLTIVRTFDKRPLYVPNSVFNTLALENPSRMSNRRIYETIGIRYQDANKMGVIIEDVKTMLRTHKEIDTKQTLICNLNSYAPSSLDFFIYTFTKTTDWIRFHEIKQDVMLKVIEIVHSHGADFAFPTTTIDGIDEIIDRKATEVRN
ncbi:MAG: mechanosensitive ion channel family protein [Pseudohongiellaceae bacterium]